MTKVKIKNRKVSNERFWSEHKDFLKVSELHSLNQQAKTFLIIILEYERICQNSF